MQDASLREYWELLWGKNITTATHLAAHFDVALFVN